jgi:hypothetical protein
MWLTVVALALPVSAGLFGWGIKYAFVGGFVIAPAYAMRFEYEARPARQGSNTKSP